MARNFAMALLMLLALGNVVGLLVLPAYVSMVGMAFEHLSWRIKE